MDRGGLNVPTGNTYHGGQSFVLYFLLLLKKKCPESLCVIYV